MGTLFVGVSRFQIEIILSRKLSVPVLENRYETPAFRA